MTTHSIVSRPWHFPIHRLATVMLVVLAWSSLAFCGEIHDAAENGELEKIQKLLKANPDLVFSKNNYGITPLFVAAANGHRDGVALLFANKAEVNAKTGAGATPLYIAAQDGYKDVAELLLANKADVNAKTDHGQTALQAAASNGHKEVVEMLLANQAEVNAKTDQGETALEVAANKGYKEVVALLLANKADVNTRDNRGITPLHMAAAMGHKEVAELLLANKAEVNARDNDGNTPLHAASSRGHKDVAELLRRHGGYYMFAQVHRANVVTAGDKIGAPPTNWPSYSSELTGLHEVRVKNPNDFKVRVGLRSEGKGKDFVVSPNGMESVKVPNGRYDIYFNYSSDLGGLYQGDSFTLENNGVEITITKVVNGNYGIRKVK